MTIYEKVKSVVTVKQAAERYRLEVNVKGMACCPFHADRHPSMKLNEDYFFCFGCGASGDVIALTAELLGIRPGEAAQRLAEDFGIGEDFHPSVLNRLQAYSTQVMEERRCFRVLTDYLTLLREWEKRYAPKSEDEAPHPRFLEACRMTEPVTYMVDLLIAADTETKRELVNSLKEDGKIGDLEKRLKELCGRKRKEPCQC